eukprot:CAMPEP_0183557826 /NCGR_PEP_ID=MMETSP0371-20130417/86699_1 /TAXON_ID=268820 /ORGANISM="Peridinium aciculiferum, Strain PAER-2" /LENGTH=49 /DNA_ID=CAMNT_0025764967 /DNA_START=19 /DNA_END=168 /DNA_ORIENTATION=-
MVRLNSDAFHKSLTSDDPIWKVSTLAKSCARGNLLRQQDYESSNAEMRP